MSAFPPAPRVFLTGGGSGLGRALALRLARRGARILVTDLDLVSAERTAQEVISIGGQAFARTCDVSRAEQIEAAAVALDERWGGVDIVLNNAGVATAGKVGETRPEDWEWVFRINFWGVFHGCHAFVPRLRQAGGGFVLNVASAAGFASLPEMGAYNATKAAVIALSETLYSEVAAHGIAVSVLCPTFFQSGLLKTLRTSDDRNREMAGAMMERSRVTADDIAEAALRGLERGSLYIVPQSDARTVWRLKRWVPAVYFSIVKRGPLLERLLKLGKPPAS